MSRNSQELLNEIGDKVIKCATYRYRDQRRGKDISIAYNLGVGYDEDHLKMFFRHLDEIGFPDIASLRSSVKCEIWLESGEYMVKGNYFYIGEESYREIPDELLQLCKKLDKVRNQINKIEKERYEKTNLFL